MRPSRPPLQFNVAREPSLEAGATHEDLLNDYRQREGDVADASGELRRNLEQRQGMRERGSGVRIDSVHSSSASSSASSISYSPKIGLLTLTGYVYTTTN